MVYSVDNVPTLYTAAAELATHKKITAKQFGGTRWIDFPGAQHTIPWVSFSSVYDPKKYGPPDGQTQPLPSNYFRGKVVFVGATRYRVAWDFLLAILAAAALQWTVKKVRAR